MLTKPSHHTFFQGLKLTTETMREPLTHFRQPRSVRVHSSEFELICFARMRLTTGLELRSSSLAACRVVIVGVIVYCHLLYQFSVSQSLLSDKIRLKRFDAFVLHTARTARSYVPSPVAMP
jgi:hypothetical protein